MIIILLHFSFTSKIELSLYKSNSAYKNLDSINSTIEDIDRSNFLTELNLGSPTQSIPLQIEMSSEDISILNNKKSSKNGKHFLSTETSNTFQIIGDKIIDHQKAVDKFSINKKILIYSLKVQIKLNLN